MSHMQKYFIECDNPECGQLFGGPDAGDYAPAQFATSKDKSGVTEIFKYLESEALDANWIRLEYAYEKAIVHSVDCALDWLRQPRTN